MKRLIQRYLLSFEKTRCQSVAPPERLDDSQELKDLITRLKDALRRSEESKHAAGAIKRQTKVSQQSLLFSPVILLYETTIERCPLKRCFHISEVSP